MVGATSRFQDSDSCFQCDFWQICRTEFPGFKLDRLFEAKGLDRCPGWMNWNDKDSKHAFEIGANFTQLKNKYLCIGLEGWKSKSNIICQPDKPISPYLLRLMISPKLNILLQIKVGGQTELIWLRSDLEEIWSCNLQSGFNAVNLERYADEGLSVFGSKQQQSYLARVLVEPSYGDLEERGLQEVWVALCHHMIRKGLPFRAAEMAA